MKLTYGQKVKAYKDWKNNLKSPLTISRELCVNVDVVKYFLRLADRHGIEILKHSDSKYYSPEEKRTAALVELREVGKLVCAEKESVGKKDISEPVKFLNLLPLGYNSEMQFEYTALTSFYYDLDKTKATANELTKVVTVNAPKQEHETHLKQDSYEENYNKQSKLRPITEKEFNAKVVELEKELDELANSKDSQNKAKKSFEKRYTKLVHNLGSYKDYEVRFKYA